MRDRPNRRCARTSSPSKISFWISGSALAPPRTVVEYGPPDQYVSSFNWICSSSVLPNTIAPRRPFPTGSAFSHLSAGWLYQSSVVHLLSACEDDRVADGTVATETGTARAMRR